MERIKGIIILLILFIIFPMGVHAVESKSSKVIDVNTNELIEVKLSSVRFDNLSLAKYTNLNNSGSPGYIISGNLYNEEDIKVDIVIKCFVYDSSKTVLETHEENISLEGKEERLFLLAQKYDNPGNIAYFSTITDVLTDLEKPKAAKGSDKSYYINKLNNNIIVTKDRHVKYNEMLEMSYSDKKEYYYRNIPRYHIYKLEDIDTSKKYIKTLEKGIDVIRIGERNKDIEKRDKLVFEYSYNYGKDYNKGYDEVEIPIINNYDSAIKNANITINLPSTKDIKDIKFIKDNKNTKIKYTIEGSKIITNIKNIKSNKIIKIIITFDDNYFKDTTSIIDGKLKFALVLPVITLLLSFVFVIILSIKKSISKEFDYSLLKQYNSLEVGYLYNDYLDDKDVMSLILSLANDGYITIEKKDDDYFLSKVKDYDKDDLIIKEFYEGLFKNRYRINEKELYDRNPLFIKNIKEKINNKYKTKFYTNLFSKYSFLLVINYIALLFITIRPTMVYDHSYMVIAIILSTILYIALIIISNIKFKNIERIITYLSVSVLYIFMLHYIIVPSIVISKLYIISYVVGIICVFININLYKMIHKRKRKYNLLIANINRLRQDILDGYVYDGSLFMYLLPYTYCIDIYKEYVSNYSEIDKPEWYICKKYNYREFINDINELLARITYDLTHNIEKR